MHVLSYMKLTAVFVAALLVPSSSGIANAQPVQTGDVMRARATGQPSQASLAELLREAVQHASSLKDARSRSGLFVAVAKARSKSDDQPGARIAFHQAIQASDAIAEKSTAIYVLEDIAVAQIGSGDGALALATMRHALDIANSIRDEHQRNTSRMWIVRTFARGGDVDTALHIVNDLPELGDYKARALANVMDGLKQSGRAAMNQFLPTLLQTAGKMQNQALQAKCLQGVAEALAAAGDIEGALKIAEAFDKAVAELDPANRIRPNVLHEQIFVLSSLAKAQAKAGNREEAAMSFKKAVDLASVLPTEGESLRSDRLSRVVRDQVDGGDIEGAIRTTDLIVYEYSRANALITIAEAQAKAGRHEQARLLFGKAIQAANEIHIRDVQRDRPQNFNLNLPVCLQTVAFVQARAGFTNEAVETAMTIDSPKWRNSALSIIAPILARAGDLKQAVELLGRIDDEKSRDYAMQGIAEGQAQRGDIPAALEWARSRATPEARANAFLGLARAVAGGT